MFRKNEDCRKEIIPNMKGGEGQMLLTHITNDDELNGKGKLYGKATLPKGSSVGLHKHEGDMELCYFLSGTGYVTDGKNSYDVKKGDVQICHEGESHEIVNTGEEDLVYTVLVLYKN